MSFERDLQSGKAAEILFRRWCDAAGFYSQAAIGSNPAWDVLLRASIEIKHDARAPSTGNFFIETHSHGKPSGVSITHSTTYALVTGKACYLVGVELLKSILPTLAERSVADGKKLGRILPIGRLLAMPHHAIDLREFQE